MGKNRVICKNCKHRYKGNFCPECGQKAKTSEINFNYFVNELPYELFQVNKGLLYTIARLTSAPGKAITEYIEGKRIRYFPPFSYVILMASFFLVAKTLTENYHMGTIYAEETVGKNNPLLGLIFVGLSPMLALSFYLVFRKKSGWNFWKYEIMIIYLMGHTLFIWMIAKLLIIPFPFIRDHSAYIILISFLYIYIAVVALHYRFFRVKIYAFMRVFGAMLVFLLLIFLVATIYTQVLK